MAVAGVAVVIVSVITGASKFGVKLNPIERVALRTDVGGNIMIVCLLELPGQSRLTQNSPCKKEISV